MVLLTAENIRKSYGTRVIFDDISFSIHEGDKIGVIGVNGTGKSTLLKIIAGVDQADSGTIVTMNGMRIGYLSQSPVFVDGTTVLQQVFRGENPQLALVREYEEMMAALAKTPEEERLVKRAAELAEKMDKAEAWSLESEAKTILTKLGISDFEQTVETLSGGQKKRVALAAALIAPVDLLILDEVLDAARLGFLPEDALRKLTGEAAPAAEVVVTGRGPAPWLLEAADYVTHMVKEKHPYDRGIAARRGVEY